MAALSAGVRGRSFRKTASGGGAGRPTSFLLAPHATSSDPVTGSASGKSVGYSQASWPPRGPRASAVMGCALRDAGVIQQTASGGIGVRPLVRQTNSMAWASWWTSKRQPSLTWLNISWPMYSTTRGRCRGTNMSTTTVNTIPRPMKNTAMPISTTGCLHQPGPVLPAIAGKPRAIASPAASTPVPIVAQVPCRSAAMRCMGGSVGRVRPSCAGFPPAQNLAGQGAFLCSPP